jgi:uncharacterized protein (TIGR03437 family)
VKGVLCVASLTLSAASLALASQADAVAISANIQAKHLPWGTIVDPIYASPTSNQIVDYTRCGDSAIWTGHYLAAESYRYAVTGSADAFANIQSAIAGIQGLVDVTGTNLLARCRVPLNSPYAASIASQENANGIHTNSSAGYEWVGNTSRDQYSGVFFGLAVAWDMVNDPGVHASITALTGQMLDYLISHLWTVVMPDGTISTTFIIRPDQQLALLQIGSHINPAKYSSTYSTNVPLLAASVVTPIAVDVQGNSSYFKFNLDYINFFNLIRLEKNPLYAAVYSGAYQILRGNTASHQNASFNMIDLALNGANSTRDRQTISYLNSWLTRASRNFTVDLRGSLPSCGSPDEACNPVPVAQRPNTDFLWQRDPFLLDAAGSGTIETSAIDYILPFWMARYYGIVDSSSVVSAATGGATTAPESIASFYGANLATTTAQATALPLPMNLGGASLKVTDSAGSAFMAPLFYASTSQINFEMPAGMATGRATVNVLQGGSVVASTTANVQTIAPALFTASACGSGVAAALSTQGSTAPKLIFSCTAGSCSSVPVVLNASTPTYLNLFGTGIRNRSAVSNVTATIGGTSVPVLYAGAQGTEVGLDQVNLSLPMSLSGLGETNLILTVDGQAANTVRVNIQ